MKLIQVLVEKLGPQALAIFARRLSAALGTKVPATVSEFSKWASKYFAENPIKVQIALSLLYGLGIEGIQSAIEENVPSKDMPVLSAVIDRYKTSDRALAQIDRIVGDGVADTIHGVPVDEYSQVSSMAKESRELIRKAIGITGSLQNLRILRDAILTVEQFELDNYGR